MKKLEWYPIYWNYIWISVAWITLFVLIFSGFGNWLLLREFRGAYAEKIACQQQWEKFNQKLDDGEIKIMLEKEDLNGR
jgi:hypothetical protein